MEDLLELYQAPYEVRRPVVCMDELCKQLIAETRLPVPVQEGHPVRYDYEYERKGVCSLLMCVEPRRGWRQVFVRPRRTKGDWAVCLRTILHQIYPAAMCVRLVQDTLNTQALASLYEAFPPRRRGHGHDVSTSIRRPNMAVG